MLADFSTYAQILDAYQKTPSKPVYCGLLTWWPLFLHLQKSELSDMGIFRFILSNSFVGFPLRATDF